MKIQMPKSKYQIRKKRSSAIKHRVWGLAKRLEHRRIKGKQKKKK